MLIRAYRIRGHLIANLDPLGLRDMPERPELDPKSYGFAETIWIARSLSTTCLACEIASMREIISIVKRTYCGTFALQYMHISDPEQAGWLKERIEGMGKEIQFTREGRKAILSKLVEAEGFEKFLHVKYMGTKRFGLDGGESLVPAMEQIIKRGGALGCAVTSSSACRTGASVGSRQRHGQTLPRDLSTNFRAAASNPKTSTARAM